MRSVADESIVADPEAGGGSIQDQIAAGFRGAALTVADLNALGFNPGIDLTLCRGHRLGGTPEDQGEDQESASHGVVVVESIVADQARVIRRRISST